MYHDIAEQLIQDILAGKYPVKLPTEQVLMNRYQASRNTIRKALDVIFAHGLVRRVQGSGYYVIDHSEQSSAVLNMSIGFDQTAMVKGGPLKSKVVKFALIPATAALARRGNVAVGDPVYQVVRLRYLKGQNHTFRKSLCRISRQKLLRGQSLPICATPMTWLEAQPKIIFSLGRCRLNMLT